MFESFSDIAKSPCNVLLHFYDCLHNPARGAVGRSITKSVRVFVFLFLFALFLFFSFFSLPSHNKCPSTASVEKRTPWNERAKQGHFAWTPDVVANDGTFTRVIVNLYVT